MQQGEERSVGETGAPVLLASQTRTYRLLLLVCVLLALPGLALMSVEQLPFDPTAAILAGLVGSLFACAAALRRERMHLVAIGVLGVPISYLVSRHTTNAWWSLGGFGIAGLLVTLVRYVRSDAETRRALVPVFVASALVPAALVATVGWAELTRRMLPKVLDTFAYRVDLTLWLESFRIGRALDRFQVIRPFLEFVYHQQWLALILLWARQLFDRRPKMDLLVATVVATLFGVAGYYAFPLLGPDLAFLGSFPHGPPPPGILKMSATLGPAVILRNCMPSMHNGWALLLVWHARPYGWIVRAAAWAMLVLTLLTTLGLGYHYVVDIVVAWPVMLAAQGIAMPSAAPARRRVAVACGFGVAIAWLLLIRYGYRIFEIVPGLSALLALATMIGTWVLHARLLSTAEFLAPPAPAAVVEPRTTGRTFWVMCAFLITGFAGLAYEVTFANWLGLTFGNTTNALTAVLATYMGGMALGSWIGGRVAERTDRPLRAYGFCEALCALFCLCAPWIVSALRAAYVSVAAGSDPARPGLAVLRMAIECVLLLPPTVMMGMTFPLVFAHLRRKGLASEAAIARSYTANTAGAALGAMLTGFVLLPELGTMGMLRLAVALGLIVALGAILAGRSSIAPPPAPATEERAAGGASDGDRRLGFAGLAFSGFVTLTLETVYDHLFAVVIGNSVYAYAVMLTAFLVGLAAGGSLSASMARLLGGRRVVLLSILAACLGAIVLVTNLVWASIPAYFTGFEKYPITNTFLERELVRFLLCLAISLPPTVCLGAVYAAAMAVAVPDGKARGVGVAGTVNTAGNIAGAVLGGLLLLPHLGSLRTLQLVGVLALAVALAMLLAARAAARAAAAGSRSWPRSGVVALAIACVPLACQPASFDIGRLASGANVYFRDNHWGRVIDWSESRDGGITSVTELDRPEGKAHTLLTNGKFQGSDSGEVEAQYAFALIPMLHAVQRDRALVIGYGTGATAHVLHAAGFQHVAIAELSEDIVRLADRHFAKLNGRVTEAPGVSLHITDGRNFLMLDRSTYDVISIEISSIWFRGAAALYNREFYEFARARLAPNGVLQQWVQLHHMQVADFVAIIATMHSVFPQVHLYERGGQGILIGCTSACASSVDALAAVLQRAALGERPATEADDTAWAKALSTSLLLDPATVDRMLEDVGTRGVDIDRLISNDDNLFLEYSTPKGNVIEDRQVDAFLQRYVRKPQTP